MLHLLGTFSGQFLHNGNNYSWVRIHYDDGLDSVRVFYNEFFSYQNGLELGAIDGVLNPNNYEQSTQTGYSSYSFTDSNGNLIRFKQTNTFPYFQKVVESTEPPPPTNRNYLGDLEGLWGNSQDGFYSYVRVNYYSDQDTILPTYYQSKDTAGNEFDPGFEGDMAGNPTGIDTTKYSAYQFCESSNLVRFRYVNFWPFFTRIIEANSFVCMNVVCDLAFDNPKIFPDHVEIEASSSYLPVEYSLDANFVYGFGQPFGHFDLEPGSWTIYAKDGAGCKKQINVFVPNIPGYGLRFVHNYRDILGVPSRVEVYERNYNGAAEEILGKQESTQIIWGEQDAERHRPINGSEAIFRWISVTNYQFIDLFTSDSEKYRVDFIKNGSLSWRGFLTPQLYSEAYIQTPYEISFTANDGLGKLKEYPYQPEYELFPTYFTGRRSHITVINDCLSKLKLDLPIYAAVNIFEENQGTLSYNGELYHETLNQVFVNTDNYRTQDGGVMNCYDVLEEQLKPYGARIYQSNGAWHVVKFDHTNREYLRHRYNVNPLTYAGSETFQPIINLTKPSISNRKIWKDEDMMLEIRPGLRYIDILQDLGYVENLIPDGELDLRNLNLYTYGSPSFTNPEFWSFTKIDNNDYALNWNENIRLVGPYGGVIKIKAIFFEKLPKTGLPPNGELLNDDLVIQASFHDFTGNGLWRVVEDGPWVRETYFDSAILKTYFLPSYGGNGMFYYLVKSGNEYYTYAVTEGEVPATSKDSYWIENKPVNIEFDVNDKLAISLNKILVYNGGSEIDVRLRIEVKVGYLYLNDAFVFTDKYNFIEIPIGKEKSFSAVEFLGTFKQASGGELRIKIWPVNLREYWPESQNSDWGNVTFNFGPDYTPNPNLLLDSIKAVYLPQGFQPPLTKTEIINNSKRFTSVPNTVNVMHGDALNMLNKDKVYDQYLTLASGRLTEKWHRKNYYERKNLLKLLLESLMAQSLSSNDLLSGEIREFITLNNTIYDPEKPNKVFLVTYAAYLDHEVSTEVKLSEITLNDDMSNELDSAFTRGFSIGYKA